MKKMLAVALIVVAGVFVFSMPSVMAGPLEDVPCNGNFDGDDDVDGLELTEFLVHFGRGTYNDPCPESPCPIICEGTLSALGRWCDQGDGTVKDMTTGLVWLKKADWGGLYPLWDDIGDPHANHRAAQLWDGSPYEGSAGLSDSSVEGDWRLPTKTEFVGITIGTEYIRYSQMYFFTGVQYYDYWSGTDYVDLTFHAWYVSMIYGTVHVTSNFVSLYVWPVRSDN